MAVTISNPMTMRWFYNTATGLTIHGTIGANFTAWFDSVNGHLAGWHQYDTRQAMEADIKAHPGWAQSVGGVGGEVGNIAKKAAGIGPGSDIYHGLNFTGWLLRLGEIALGLVLIAEGIAKLTGTDNMVIKTATAIGKAAMV
jgi:hypothetical protein